MVSRTQWEEAQKGEINHHVENFNLNIANKNHYHNNYKNIFSCIDPEFNFDLKNKKIMEIGPGVFASLLYSQNFDKSFIVEPLDLPQNVIDLYEKNNITILKGSVEELNLPKVDEVWVFNVMQHIWNPNLFVEKLKKIADKILFFEPINTPIDDLHIHSYTLEDFYRFFGSKNVKEYSGGSIPNFHTANCAYGLWDKKLEDTGNIGVIGIGKLGLCFALTLERAGYNVCGVDKSFDYVSSINLKEYKTSEPFVEDYLKTSRNFIATTDLKFAVEFAKTFFVIVATPSLPNGDYDHSQVDSVVEKIKSFGVQEETKHLVVCCTVSPGYCDSIQEELKNSNWLVSYNPEFIAQGTVIKNQENPDMVLIGEANPVCGNQLQNLYLKICQNSPKIHKMSRISAEITKIGLNCFLITKIAYANMLGDISETVGAETEKILKAIGDDSRIGQKFFKYGFGFGGPCLPRDARVLAKFAKDNDCNSNIALASDEANKLHLEKQLELTTKKFSKKEPIYFHHVTYKPESILIEESQQLKYAVGLAEKGYKVILNEREEVISEIQKEYKNLFEYQTRLQRKNKKVISFTLFGTNELYLQGAIENAKLAFLHFPNWECRFYIDTLVPEIIKNNLKQFGANIIQKSNSDEYKGLFWRFEPINEEDVDVWISRDVDSRLSEKDSLAVEDWLTENKTFHIMRDSHNHDLYCIMAGMFGVRNDLFRKKYGKVDLTCPDHMKNKRDSDQLVLQERIWNLMERDHVCHEHWAHNKPVGINLSNIGRDPTVVYQGQGVVGHVTNRRKNYPNQFTEGSINKPFPTHKKPKYGLYLGQIITEKNVPVWNEEVQWEYELRGEKW